VTLPLSYSRSNQPSAISLQPSLQLLASAADFHSLNKFLEPMTRIELVTSPLPRECSTN
jgi:hypothetical protein